MPELITQGEVHIEPGIKFPAPVKLTFSAAGYLIKSQYENILDNGTAVWWNPDNDTTIHVPLTEKEAFKRSA